MVSCGITYRSVVTTCQLPLIWYAGSSCSSAILVKSVVLATAAALVAKHFGKVSILALLIAILAYQLIGTGAEWAMTGSLFTALQDFRLGVPGMLIQLIGGYFLLQALRKV